MISKAVSRFTSKGETSAWGAGELPDRSGGRLPFEVAGHVMPGTD
jgi:hypothetical protein